MAELNFDKLCENVANQILDHTEYYGRTFRKWVEKLAKYVAEQEGSRKEKTERLTIREWQNLDPWECCGQDDRCTRKPNEAGGCRKGCIVPKIYAKLAKIEDEQERTAGMIINKNVIYSVDGFADGNPVYETAECPACGFNFEKYTSTWGEPFCPHCGQRLEWGINEGEGAE